MRVELWMGRRSHPLETLANTHDLTLQVRYQNGSYDVRFVDCNIDNKSTYFITGRTLKSAIDKYYLELAHTTIIKRDGTKIIVPGIEPKDA